MASANLDFVRSLFAGWERGDFSSAEWAHREIEFVFADGIHAGTWRGLAEMARAWREFGLSTWEELRVKAEEYRELDDGRVLVLYRWAGRGRTSGLEIGQVAAGIDPLRHSRREGHADGYLL